MGNKEGKTQTVKKGVRRIKNYLEVSVKDAVLHRPDCAQEGYCVVTARITSDLEIPLVGSKVGYKTHSMEKGVEFHKPSGSLTLKGLPPAFCEQDPEPIYVFRNMLPNEFVREVSSLAKILREADARPGCGGSGERLYARIIYPSKKIDRMFSDTKDPLPYLDDLRGYEILVRSPRGGKQETIVEKWQEGRRRQGRRQAAEERWLGGC